MVLSARGSWVGKDSHPETGLQNSPVITKSVKTGIRLEQRDPEPEISLISVVVNCLQPYIKTNKYYSPIHQCIPLYFWCVWVRTQVHIYTHTLYIVYIVLNISFPEVPWLHKEGGRLKGCCYWVPPPVSIIPISRRVSHNLHFHPDPSLYRSFSNQLSG